MGKTSTSKRPSSVSDFKRGPEPVELPSGHFITIKKVGLQALIAGGQIPNELLGMIQSAIDKGKGDEKKIIQKAVALDADKMNQMIDLMNNTVCFCAQDPEVHPVPKDDEARDPEKLYIDELEEEDRVFIFQYVTGGTRDLESFRAEHGRIVATVSGQ